MLVCSYQSTEEARLKALLWYKQCLISAGFQLTPSKINKTDRLVNSFPAVRNMSDTSSGFLKDYRLHFLNPCPRQSGTTAHWILKAPYMSSHLHNKAGANGATV